MQTHLSVNIICECACVCYDINPYYVTVYCLGLFYEHYQIAFQKHPREKHHMYY